VLVGNNSFGLATRRSVERSLGTRVQGGDDHENEMALVVKGDGRVGGTFKKKKAEEE